MAIFQRRIVETRASFNFRASKQRGFAINVKSPRPDGYKFRGANKFRARLQGIKVLNGGRGGGEIKWMKRNEPHDFSAWTEFSILAPLFVHSTNSCILFFHYVSIYLFFSFLFFFVYDSSTTCSASSLWQEKKKKKKKGREKKLILPLYRHTSNRSYNYNMTTRFRYMKEKKKEQKKMEKEEEKKERK